MKNNLWVEKYRPSSTADYVFVDDRQKQQVEGWIKSGTIPHLLLSGDAGTGKTTLAKVLIKELEIEEYDVMEINASREGRIEDVREKINGFVSTMPFGKFKVLLLDEADYLSRDAQAALRNDMEAYADTVRYILTCNYVHKVIPALKSRCHEFHIAKPDITDFLIRVATVLSSENIEADPDTLDSYVRATYPDLRKCLNQVQVNSSTGKLLPPINQGSGEEALLIEAATLFKKGNITEGRKQLMQYLGMYPTRLEEIYRWMYNNLNLWGDSNEQRDKSIIVIRNGLANLSLVGIPEISLAATLVELTS